MIEVTGNLWTYPAKVVMITTNGSIRKDGCCVMGRGCAKEAMDKFPGINKALGRMIEQHGNHVHLLRKDDPVIFSFPVKHKWMEKADIDLIRRSAEQLASILDPWFPNDEGNVFVLPRPGCGNGQLKWEDVKPILAPILDDRFHVITFA